MSLGMKALQRYRMKLSNIGIKNLYLLNLVIYDELF